MIPRKRHVDVLEAVAALDDVDWLVIGDGPELPGAARARPTSSASSDRVEFAGQLAPDEALRAAGDART